MARGAGPRTAALLEEGLDLPVFERVKGNHGERAARREQAFGGAEAAAQFADLVVDVDPDRLKGAGRRVAARLATADHAADDLGELAGAGDWLDPPGGHDGLGDPPGLALLAVAPNDIGQLAFG
jgi:hypothetical protein